MPWSFTFQRPHRSSRSTPFHKWKHSTHGCSISNKFPTLPEGKPCTDFIGSSTRRGWRVGSFSPIPLLAKASHLSILHTRPALPAVLFGCSLWTAVKSIRTEPPFGCQHGQDRKPRSNFGSRGLLMSQCSQIPEQLHWESFPWFRKQHICIPRGGRRQSWGCLISTFLQP